MSTAVRQRDWDTPRHVGPQRPTGSRNKNNTRLWSRCCGRSGRKMVGALNRPQHLHKLKPYVHMLWSKLDAKQIRALNSVHTHKRAAIIPLTKNQKGGFIGAMLASLGIPILMKALGIWFFCVLTSLKYKYKTRQPNKLPYSTCSEKLIENFRCCLKCQLKIIVYTVTSVSFLFADLGSSVARVPSIAWSAMAEVAGASPARDNARMCVGLTEHSCQK